MTRSPGDRPVQHYVIAQGRVAPTRNTLRLETLLIASSVPAERSHGMSIGAIERVRTLPRSASREEIALHSWCRRPLSIIEAAAHLGLPPSVVTVVASQMIDAGHLKVHAPATPLTGPAEMTHEILEQVIHGLQAL